MEPCVKRGFVRAGIDTEREAGDYRERIARKPHDEFLAGFLSVLCHRARTDDREQFCSRFR